ncbi:iron complex outermembrane recepter protein [Parapedobacter composti]|uniref:Iron complex outermembrane recepter protein n=1 Tax=Parapedobacter composti TaxID=623281 RepID=A0A1I1E920_9SPHI|nr:TonB-dependent receptor [Parapedobacter composti]SFB83689.1 iron complex outermembrane recepter protein [Parapedobacter composti]
MNISTLLRTIVSWCIVAWVFQAEAQEHKLAGHIYDSQTNQPVAGVSISDQAGRTIGQTDTDGRFSVLSIHPLSVIQVTAMGYRPKLVDLSDGRTNVNIQLDADPVRLDEVRVGLHGRANRETPGSVALLTADDIQRGSGVSLQQALNTVPGVRMDQSTLADSRISIRGNGVRSPWGIRAVKVYLNDIPITEADGTTRIEAIDVNTIGRAEIIKGPASSIYGAGTAGVLNFQLQRAPYGERNVALSALTGRFGLNRVTSAYRSGGDRVNSYVAYGWQEYDGYRTHSSDMRRFVTGNFQLFPNDKQIITVLLNRTSQFSQIPGALTQDELDDNPTQANASNVEKAAGRNQHWTRVGIGQQYRFNSRFTNSTSVFSYFYDLDHPLAFAYIRNYYQSYGGRTRFSYDLDLPLLPTVFTLGAEFNQGLTKGSQYRNEQGKEGPITANIDYQNTAYALFFQSETRLSRKTLFTLGLGVNSLQYRVSDYLAPHQSGAKRFTPVAMPRAALSHTIHDALTLHASIGTGFTPPTTAEIKLADGSINARLRAERAVNYEVNAKGVLTHSRRLSYDLSLFWMNMSDELIAQSVQQGITIYNNAGKTTHRGIEAAFSWLLLDDRNSRWLQRLRPYAAVTYSDFTFADYKTLDASNTVTAVYDGNRLTGIAPWVVSAGIDCHTKAGFYAHCDYLYSDRLALNDANTAYHPSYHVLNAKVGYSHVFSKRIKTSIYGGVDNLLNQQYSAFVALNAVSYSGGQPPYYNPSPSRNGYGGINFSYLF